MDEIKAIQDELSRPFDRKDVEFRVSRASAEYKRVNVVPYVTARGIMQRLERRVRRAGCRSQIRYWSLSL